MKTILITGATDGLGRETAQRLDEAGHRILLHGRSAEKLAATAEAISGRPGAGPVESFRADLSDLAEVAALADAIASRHDRLDVLINNAGVFRVPAPVTPDGLDIRFVVNTLAPALLTRRLLPVIPAGGRIVHLSSAAQAPVELDALVGRSRLAAMAAYAQNKLALTIWSQALAAEIGPDGPVSVAVNPGSLLATRMVKEGFGVAGQDVGLGADIVVRAVLSDAFAGASGCDYDNGAGTFALPHSEAGAPVTAAAVAGVIEGMIARYLEPGQTA